MEKIEIVCTCPFCEKESIVTVNFIDYLAWQSGELIQNAFPYLSVSERELLISGICEDCWNGMFGKEEV